MLLLLCHSFVHAISRAQLFVSHHITKNTSIYVLLIVYPMQRKLCQIFPVLRNRHTVGQSKSSQQHVRRQEQHLSSHQQGRILGGRDRIRVSLSLERTAAAARGVTDQDGARARPPALVSRLSDSCAVATYTEHSHALCLQMCVSGHTRAGTVKETHADAARNREV